MGSACQPISLPHDTIPVCSALSSLDYKLFHPVHLVHYFPCIDSSRSPTRSALLLKVLIFVRMILFTVPSELHTEPSRNRSFLFGAAPHTYAPPLPAFLLCQHILCSYFYLLYFIYMSLTLSCNIDTADLSPKTLLSSISFPPSSSHLESLHLTLLSLLRVQTPTEPPSLCFFSFRL